MEIGKLPENVLKRSVLRQLKTETGVTGMEIGKGAGVGNDCAFFSLDDSMLFTCMQEAAVAVETERFSEDACVFTTMPQLLQRTANNLAAGGSRIVAVMITLLLPAAIEEPVIKQLMKEAETKCEELQIAIIGGQTSILSTVTVPTAVITGYGQALMNNKPDAGKKTGKAKQKVTPGQDLVLTKWIGLEGSAILARKYREKLLTRYPEYLINEAAGFDKYLSVIPEAATAIESGVSAMHDLSQGGVFGALWEFAESAGVGLTIDLKKIPLRQETVEVCELCEVNPYELLSGGSMLMAAADGPGLVMALEAAGIPAIIIGRTTDSKDRIILNADETRYMDRPKQDEIFRRLGKQ